MIKYEEKEKEEKTKSVVDDVTNTHKNPIIVNCLKRRKIIFGLEIKQLNVVFYKSRICYYVLCLRVLFKSLDPISFVYFYCGQI